MESIVKTIVCVAESYAFEGGIIGIGIGILLVAGLVYLFINRNQVMTIPYGLTLFGVFVFLIICIITLLTFSIYGVTNWNKLSAGNFKNITAKILLTLVALCPIFVVAQGINYPNNSPINNGGAGNARTDADNLFTRNNPAALTEIEDDEATNDNIGRWRVMSEFHITYYKYRREFIPFGFNQKIKSEDSILLPTGSGEITYTAKSRKFAFGIGLSQTFGFESKLKDDENILGNQAAFFDTRVASNDIAAAGAYRVNEKISVGGSFILGRAFLVQTAPIQQLAQIGIVKLSRLDVKETGGYGASFNIHLRPTEKVNFGFNFKTARKYNLSGTLDSIQPVITPQGLQLFPVKLDVQVPFKLPLIAETGIKIQPTNRIFFDFDYRFYNYSQALNQLTIFDKTNKTQLANHNIKAKNVHLLSFGGAYKLNQDSKILFGSGFQNNAIIDSSFTPALNNAGGISFSGGLAKKMSGVWMNLGVTAIFSLNRNIPANNLNLFPGNYKANGFTIGWGVRK